jgi:predicted Holliday junction resolvase-like endonuclease
MSYKNENKRGKELMEELLVNYAKEGVFLALFLYLLIFNIPKLKQEFKQDMREMEDRHRAEIDRVEKRYQEEMEKMEKKAEIRESELIRLLSMFEGKYELLTGKVDEVLKRLKF